MTLRLTNPKSSLPPKNCLPSDKDSNHYILMLRDARLKLSHLFCKIFHRSSIFFSLKRIWLSIRIEFNLHRIRTPLKNPQIWKLNWKYGQFCFQWQSYGWRTSSVNKVGRLPDFLESWTKLDENSSFGHRDSNSFKRTMPLHKWEMSLQLCFRLEYWLPRTLLIVDVDLEYM